MVEGLQMQVQGQKLYVTKESLYHQRIASEGLQRRLQEAESWLQKLGYLALLVHFLLCQNLVSIVQEEVTTFVRHTMQVLCPREWGPGFTEECGAEPVHVGSSPSPCLVAPPPAGGRHQAESRHPGGAGVWPRGAADALSLPLGAGGLPAGGPGRCGGVCPAGGLWAAACALLLGGGSPC